MFCGYALMHETIGMGLNGFFITFFCEFLEPKSAPRNVNARPLSSSQMLVNWDEPETPNGQITVRRSRKKYFDFLQLLLSILFLFSFCFSSPDFLCIMLNLF